MILQAMPKGPAYAERWVITNTEDNTYWSGTSFTEDANEAVVYNSLNETFFEIQCVLRLQYKDKKRRYFLAPVEVEVYGNASDEEIIEWLSKSTMLSLSSECGNGPSESLVLPKIRWGDLKKVD